MAPIKFEDNLKEKLEQRRLQPSPNAWKTLHSKLDNNIAKRSNKPFLWLGIAASFVGILIVATVFFNNETNTTIEQEIVDIEDTKIPIKNSIPNVSNEIQQVTLEEPQAEKLLINTKSQIVDIKPILQNKQDELIKTNVNNTVAKTDVKTNEMPEKDSAIETKILTFEDIKLQEVITQVQELIKNNQTVLDADIDALLDEAQKEITLNKLYNESTKTVDADALLQDVETDLEQSFRERAFKAIKSGYNYVKTTVAERNN
ncbi:MAG: hypothetical protein DRI75_06295 [Bacteroidetes bacterium]|nr:MAG: hypothetical protein DRI75_06295 [Bacteroidota bacterium]